MIHDQQTISTTTGRAQPVPEKTRLNLGFIPLTDCAPLVVAKELGYFEKYGLDVSLSKQASWANIRDKVAVGALDGAHMLAAMPIAMSLGLDALHVPMLVPLALDLNGNAITVSRHLYQRMLEADPSAMAQPPLSAQALKQVIEADRRQNRPPLVFAMVFPFSSHNYLLRYWLASAGIDPDRDIRLCVVPPPRMVAQLQAGSIDGYCVGEPWNARAVAEGVGQVVITSYEIWNNHPEKVFGVSRDWAERYPNTLQALLMALLEAARCLDRPEHRGDVAKLIADENYVAAPEAVVRMSMAGNFAYTPGETPRPLPDFNVFYRHAATFPWLSHAEWLITQMVRWGQSAWPNDIRGAAAEVYRPDLYRQAARLLGLPCPSVDHKREGEHAHSWTLQAADLPIAMGADRFFDGQVYDPAHPLAYLQRFALRRTDTGAPPAPLPPNPPPSSTEDTPMNDKPELEQTPAAAGLDSPSRRKFFQTSATVLGASALMGLAPLGLSQGVWAAGSDAPEKTEVKVGFIPLTDCASVVMAAELGLDKKYGIKIVPSKEASWAAVRDKLANGELDAAHVLYGLIYGVHLGIGGPKKDMAVLMTLNNNGQAITLADQVNQKGVTDGESLASLLKSEPRQYTFAQTFPTGTHAMWLYYWLASYGINPLKDVKTVVVPPPQMVANMRVGNMDGYCVGEPWNARAIADKIGFTAATTQDIWKDHPEKVLGTTADWVKANPNTARALIMAVLEASQYIDDLKNRPQVAKVIAGKAYVNAPEEVIEGRMLGHYDNGIGKSWEDPNYMKFYNGGAVNFPYLSDGMWFLTQHRRWGLLDKDPDYLAVAKQINQIDLYKEAATQLKVPLPAGPMRSSTLLDGAKWDGSNPAAYAASFAVKA